MQEGRDVFYDEIVAAADPECPAEPLDAEHPLYILYTSGSTAKPKGILHTTGGYLTGVSATHRYVFDLKPESDVYWCAADVGWVTGHSYIVYGPLCNGATSVMWEGAPDYPDKGIWWEIVERYGVTILYCAPTAIRACIKWGAQWPERARSLEPAAARQRRRADQPEGVALVPQGDRRRALPDRRHVVADRDGRDHDHAAARHHARRSRARRRSPFPGVFAEVLGESTGRADRGGPGAARARRGRGRRCCARSTRRTSASSRPTSRASARETYLVGDAARRDRDGYYLGDRAHRRRRQRLRPPALDGRGRVGDRGPSRRRRGGGDRPARRGHRPGDRRVRDAAGRRCTATSATVEGIRETVAERIGKFARPKRIIWTDDLPKTRSGKIMRRLLRDIAEGRALGDVTTLRDPAVMGAARGAGQGAAGPGGVLRGNPRRARALARAHDCGHGLCAGTGLAVSSPSSADRPPAGAGCTRCARPLAGVRRGSVRGASPSTSAIGPRCVPRGDADAWSRSAASGSRCMPWRGQLDAGGARERAAHRPARGRLARGLLVVSGTCRGDSA